jgi:hypothetical protein
MSTDRDRLFEIVLGEIETCSGHKRHGSWCNCRKTAGNVIRRLEMEGVLPELPDWSPDA